MMKLPMADGWIIANYPVFRAALQMPLSGIGCSLRSGGIINAAQHSLVAPFGRL